MRKVKYIIIRAAILKEQAYASLDITATNGGKDSII
jgi:hypothetical protein